MYGMLFVQIRVPPLNVRHYAPNSASWCPSLRFILQRKTAHQQKGTLALLILSVSGKHRVGERERELGG